MSHLLVSGSIAFDRIAVFPDKFAKHILPDKIHQLNVVFSVKDMVLQHGGTGANIAYNLALLGESPYLFGTVGFDGQPFIDHLEKTGIKTDHVKKIDHLITANCTITTDLADNQIIAFCDGALAEAEQSSFEAFDEEVFMATLSVNDAKIMLKDADICRQRKIPFMFDPGQRIPVFSGQMLKEAAEGAHILIANDYEWQLIKDKTDWNESSVLDHVKHLIVTYGEKGSKIFSKEGEEDIVAHPVADPVDPTGSGDAYRAGLMYGLKNDYSMKQAAGLGSWLAAKVVQTSGTQNHLLDSEELKTFLSGL